MTLAEIIPAIRELPAADKLHLIRILAEDLDAASENSFSFVPGGTYPIYSPYDSHEAAAAVANALIKDQEVQDS